MLKNNTTFVKKQHSTLGHLPRHLRHQRQLRRRPRRRAPDMYRECILCVMYLYGMYPK